MDFVRPLGSLSFHASRALVEDQLSQLEKTKDPELPNLQGLTAQGCYPFGYDGRAVADLEPDFEPMGFARGDWVAVEFCIRSTNMRSLPIPKAGGDTACDYCPILWWTTRKTIAQITQRRQGSANETRRIFRPLQRFDLYEASCSTLFRFHSQCPRSVQLVVNIGLIFIYLRLHQNNSL